MPNALNQANKQINQIPLWTKELKYKYIIDNEIKRIVSAKEVIGYNRERALRISNQSISCTDEEARYRCEFCEGPLKLLMNPKKSGFYFRHKNNYNKNCPYLVGEEVEECGDLRAKIHQGRQVSLAHEAIISRIKYIIKHDSGFSDIITNKYIVDREQNQRRMPDLQCIYKGKKIVFEVQISEELRTEIMGRSVFYGEYGAYLLWIIDKYDVETARGGKMTIQDQNHANSFVLDDDAIQKSGEEKTLYLKCFMENHVVTDDKIESVTQCKLVRFKDLIFDDSDKTIYAVDAKKNHREASEKLFIQLWDQKKPQHDDDRLVKGILRECFGKEIEDSNIRNLAKLVTAIMSIRKDKPDGYAYKKNIQIFQLMFDRLKSMAFVYIAACFTYQRIPSATTYKAEQNIKAVIKSLIDENEFSPYYPSPREWDVIECVFPSLHKKMRNYLGNKDELSKMLACRYVGQ